MNNNGMKKRWISLYVENQVGVLSKISGLFSGKSYNLDSLTVGTTEDPTVSRMTIATVSDDETFEQIMISAEDAADSMKFVKENDNVKMVSYKGNIFAIEPPMFAELEVTETEPGVKGDTATNVTKPATVETGAQVAVPIFVNQGDKIQINTRTGEYLKRL